MLVLSIVSLIMFFELVKRPELVDVAVLQVSPSDRTGKCRLSYRLSNPNYECKLLFCPPRNLYPAHFIIFRFGEKYKA